MTGFFSLPEYLQFFLVFYNLIILILNIYCLVYSIILRANKRSVFSNFILSLCTTAFFLIFITGNYGYRKHMTDHGVYIGILSEYFSVLAVSLAVISLLSFLCICLINRWKNNYITPASIKEAMDRLPAGLCYHNEKGTSQLINHRMNELSRMITGELPIDGNQFWHRITKGRVIPGNRVEKWGINPIITISDGTTLSFTKVRKEIAGEIMYEIRATDITTQYSLNKELQEYNDELLSYNRRLQEYGENVWDITREREILSAKVSIHDMLGKAQLITKRYIENNGADISREELLEMWQATVYLFEGGFSEKQEENGLDELYNAAKIMGISLIINGRVPKDNQVLRFIMGGARECLTNAVHHAKATELTVTLSHSCGFAVIEYTNDGIQPTQPISEGGGLSSLRQSVESEGGIMETEIFPRFVLRLKIPSKEVSYV